MDHAGRLQGPCQLDAAGLTGGGGPVAFASPGTVAGAGAVVEGTGGALVLGPGGYSGYGGYGGSAGEGACGGWGGLGGLERAGGGLQGKVGVNQAQMGCVGTAER